MVSEVVANAVRHGTPKPDGRIGLRLQGEADVARAMVTDAAPVFSFDRETFAQANPDHFGLSIVDGLADRWGLSLDGKKAVWFEVGSPSRLIVGLDSVPPVASPDLSDFELLKRPI